jgi:alkanesulfonate monooxygenase SsuD/methylene tetrahydromethanopterin reductase-like flavin-dependent oxidoreductase (luciferase family)
VLKLLWTAESVDFDGKYYRLHDAHLASKPVSKPRPPIWIGGFSPAVLSLIVKYGDGWTNATNAAPEDVKKEREALVRLPQENGRAQDDVIVVVPLMSMLSKSNERAEQAARGYMERGKFDKTLRFFADTMKFGLVDTPAKCIERIKRYESAGVSKIVFDVKPPTQ